MKILGMIFFITSQAFSNSNYCIKVAQTSENHFKGHRAVAGSAYSACLAAEKDCRKFHAKCRTYDQRNVRQVTSYRCSMIAGQTQVHLRNSGRLSITASGYGRVQYYDRIGRMIERKSVFVYKTVGAFTSRQVYQSFRSPKKAYRCRFDSYGIRHRFNL